MKPSKRRLLFAFAFSLGAPVVCTAQSGLKPHIGYLSPGNVPRYDNAFLEGLQEQNLLLPGEITRYDDPSWAALTQRGRFDGRRVRIDVRASAKNYPVSAIELARDLVRQGVDIFYTATTAEAFAARQAARDASRAIPVVLISTDPVGTGLVSSLARPGGEVTGLLRNDSELEGKRLELLTETVPGLSRVAYLYEPNALPPDLNAQTRTSLNAASDNARIQLEFVEVARPDAVGAALERITASGAQGVLVQFSPALIVARRQVLEYVNARRLPAAYGEGLFVEEGGLMFYGTPYVDLARRAAGIVAKIIRGTKPSDVPVERATQVKLIINRTAARALGITIPRSILIRAEVVYGN